MIGGDEITIMIDAQRIRLRATLRAAMRLERRHGGFGAILKGIRDGSLTVAADLIEQCAIEPIPASEILSGMGASVLFTLMHQITPALVNLVFALAGIDPDAEPERDKTSAEAIPYRDHHVQLFRIATGWLGWSSAEAWDASPVEIMEAYRGRIDLLKAIFGGTDEAEAKKVDLPLDEKVKLAFQSLGTKVVHRNQN